MPTEPERPPALPPTGHDVGRQAPGDQLLRAKLNEYDYLVQMLPEADVPRYEQTLTAVRNALAHRLWGRLPRPRYDAAWAQLHQLRSFLCHGLSLAHLLGAIAEDVEADIEYLDHREAREARRELDEIRGSIVKRLQPGEHATDSDHLLRTRLQALSKDAGEAHEAQWLRVNMMRQRLTVMGLMLLAVLPAAVWRLPAVMNEGRPARFYFAVALFGAIGGLISALLTQESLDERITQYYVRRRLLFLRPLIGAALALVGYSAVRAGLLSVAGVKEDSTAGAFLALAFLAGFAERAFVKRILDSASAQGRGSSRGARRGGDD